jgi:phosphoglycerate dehydrogenase-like enzyme
MNVTSPLRIGVHLASMQGADIVGHGRTIGGIEIIGVESVEELEELAFSCDALFLNSPRYTPKLAQNLADTGSRVRWIQFSSAGYETAEALGVPWGIEVTNCGSAWSATVAEHAVALVLGLLRCLPRAICAQRWDAAPITPHLGSLEGARVGLLGFGDIGRETALRLRPFGCTTVALVRSARPCDDVDEVIQIDRLDTALPTLDVLILALPLTEATFGIVDARMLSLLKKTAILVNVGRGGCIVEADVADALRQGRLGGFGLDVAAAEPLLPQSPFWGAENVIITPHIAAMGGKALDRLLALFHTNIVNFRDGLPLLSRVMPVPPARPGE